MSLAPGGRMQPHIPPDPFAPEDWDLGAGLRCSIAILTAADWQQLTGAAPRHKRLSASDYAQFRVPWFDHYDDGPARPRECGYADHDAGDHVPFTPVMRKPASGRS
jgi:hypothetical protein